jgi:hypothetical protein
MYQDIKNALVRAGARRVVRFGLVIACIAAEVEAQTVAHPLVGETLDLQTTSSASSVVSFKGAAAEAIRYQLPFAASSVSKLYVGEHRALLVGSAGMFEFGASFSLHAGDATPDSIMIGHGFSVDPGADYLAWIQFYPRMALDPDQGTVRLMKMTNAIRMMAPPGEFDKEAGVVLFHAPSGEILLYPALTWSNDGRLAFLSRSRAGQVKLVVCRVASLQCQSVGSVEVETVDKSGKHRNVNQVRKLTFVQKGISLDLISSSSKASKRLFPVSF